MANSTIQLKFAPFGKSDQKPKSGHILAGAGFRPDL